MVKLEATSSLRSRKSFALNASSQFTIEHELAPPLPAFAVGDVSGKVWSTLISTQQGGIYPQTSLGFAIQRVSSPAPIYWRFALHAYIPCANILALRVQSVKAWVRLFCICIPSILQCGSYTHQCFYIDLLIL